MCDMSGRKDPCWLSKVELPPRKGAARVNNITSFRLDEEDWKFGIEPFHRGNRAPLNTMDGPNTENLDPDQEDSDSDD
ncbi:hypothetical protein D1007_36030 [Hordeum vulgare]|nr:hypothetical protein D1007_36030 [Hordeum vulgare]